MRVYNVPFLSFKRDRKTKTIPWSEFFQIDDDPTVTLKVIPDRTLNNRQNAKLMRALHELYTNPLSRFSCGKWFIRYQPQARIWYDVVMTDENIKFYFTLPARWEKYARQKLALCWPKASIETVEGKFRIEKGEDGFKVADADNELHLPDKNTQVAEMVLKRHNIFALHVDHREDTQPLGAIMAASSDLKDNDKARFSICLEPVNRMNWNDLAEQAHKQFSKGKTPQRAGLSKRKALLSLGTTLENIFSSFGDFMLLFLGHDDKQKTAPDYEKRELLLDGRLGSVTNAKKIEPTFKARVCLAAHSHDKERREIAIRAMANSFVEIAGDNEFERVDIKSESAKKRICEELSNHKLHPMTVAELDNNIVGATEAGKLTQLPGAGLQEEFGEQLETISLRQTDLPPAVTNHGMKLGEQEYKNQVQQVYQPTDNDDELCLPHIGIGGMGTGKTKGFAANFAVEAVRNNYGAICIDPAKGEMGDEIETALPAEKVIRIDLSKMLVSLDWCEVEHSPRVKNRLANTMMAFFNTAGDDAGVQTERYLRAAVLGMQTGKLSELMRIFENDVYRKKIIKEMPEGLNKQTLISFGKESEAMQRKIMAPIYNRMATVLGDEYLAECMECENSLDFVELLQERKAIIIDIPSRDFDGLAIDLLVNLISTKIDLAMRLRPENNQFPFFVIFDEPHQYLRSTTLWRAAAVESRKWRIGYVWLFHSWEQIPSKLAEIIKAAGPHYHIYRSSQKTYRDLALEIAPFTIEEGIKTPTFHAINVIRAGGMTLKPFMARMTPPPSKQKQAS